MNKSEQINEIAVALAKFQKEVKAVKLDSTVRVPTKNNSSFQYRYATLENIINTVKTTLADCELSFVQAVGLHGEVETCLMHKSGQWISTVTNINGSGQHTAQEYGSLISYTRRYALLGILGIVGESDDDAQTADKPQEKRAEAQPQQEPMDDMDRALNETYEEEAPKEAKVYPASDKQKNFIRKLLTQKGKTEQEIETANGKKIDDMTGTDASGLIGRLLLMPNVVNS